MYYRIYNIVRLLSVMVALMCVACDSSVETATPDQPKESKTDNRLAGGDMLSLDNGKATVLRGDWLVSPEGDVTLPFIGSVRVAGLTREEASKKIESAYDVASVQPDPIQGVR